MQWMSEMSNSEVDPGGTTTTAAAKYTQYVLSILEFIWKFSAYFLKILIILFYEFPYNLCSWKSAT